ncbi:MAG: hypothetical protein H0T79_21590 [Deltaproteobacteria bacterium]|nr:hypothetical protein [Deltaproteobacteria bacterium]
MEARFFKWACLGIATFAVAALLWMLNDLRMEAKHTTAAVNEHLPAVLANVKQGTATLVQLTKDVEALRDLAGIASTPRDRSLVVYADSVLDFLDAQQGKIGVEKVLGKELKDLVPVQEWVTAARKEAVWLTFRANSKHELLDRLGKTKFGSDWFFAPADGPPVRLIEFLEQTHPASK